jgi:hypothetical protein
VLRLFETQDRLVGLEGAALLDRRLRVVDDAVVGQEVRFGDGTWHPESVTLRLESGLPFSAELDAPTARLVRVLDGSRTLREALAESVEDEETRSVGLDLAREMLEVGFLELAD